MRPSNNILLKMGKKEIAPGYFEIKWVDCDTQNRGNTTGVGWGAYAVTDITGVLKRTRWQLEAKCIRTGSVGEWNFLCGSELTDNETGYIKLRMYGSGDNGWEHNTGSTAHTVCPLGVVQNISIEKRVVTINDYQTWTVNSSNVVNRNKFCIGGAELVTARSDGYKRTWCGLIGRVKVSQDGVTYGDFYPSKKKSDGTVGFYDLVSEKFYPSSNPSVHFKEGKI